ncbi:MAG: hypothetical protein HQK78_20240, partial [Desulfobacterales bacterium]|nr:hypothetical protein [Desulfobacterales bacterium]
MSRLNENQKEKIREVFQKTGSIRETVKQTGISRNAVRNELRQLGRPEMVKAQNAGKRKSKLDPYNAKIAYLIQEKKLSGVRILEEIK